MLYIPPAVEEPDEEDFDINIILTNSEKQNKTLGFLSLKGAESMAMDQAKNFENFLRTFNLSVVAKEYEAACMKRTYLNRYKNASKRIT